uniref:Uncharacterized protein n=1 Tax=Tetranychus urticae TaxID=32264 RepID=T1KMH6_TETUR
MEDQLNGSSLGNLLLPEAFGHDFLITGQCEAVDNLKGDVEGDLDERLKQLDKMTKVKAKMT